MFAARWKATKDLIARKTVKARRSAKNIVLSISACLGLVVILVTSVAFGASLADANSVTSLFGNETSRSSVSQSSVTQSVFDSTTNDDSSLRKTAHRDISLGIQTLAAKEEADRKAAEEAAAAAEAKRVAEEAARQAAIAERQASAQREALAIGLAPVDWSIGKDAFINEWGVRIDAYLSGSPLAGQGRAFAESSWNYGVDPRWSPAISNTESTKGRHCFLPYNAWGWGASSWSNWPQAIDSHVKGLANGYGSMISYWAAQKYCPPNADNWYRNTLSQMHSI